MRGGGSAEAAAACFFRRLLDDDVDASLCAGHPPLTRAQHPPTGAEDKRGNFGCCWAVLPCLSVLQATISTPISSRRSSSLPAHFQLLLPRSLAHPHPITAHRHPSTTTTMAGGPVALIKKRIYWYRLWTGTFLLSVCVGWTAPHSLIPCTDRRPHRTRTHHTPYSGTYMLAWWEQILFSK